MNSIKRAICAVFAIVFLFAFVVHPVTGSSSLATEDSYHFPRNIIFVIDGCMLEDYSSDVINSIRYFVELMPFNQSRIGGIVYYPEGAIYIELESIASQDDKNKYIDKYNNATSGEHIDAGYALEKAVTMLSQYSSKKQPSSIILITDGRNEPEDLVERDKNYTTWERAISAAKYGSITMHSICLNSDGSALDKVLELMQRMKKDTHGNFYDLQEIAALSEKVLALFERAYDRQSDRIFEGTPPFDGRISEKKGFFDDSEELKVVVEGNAAFAFMQGKDQVEIESNRKELLEIGGRTLTILTYSKFESNNLSIRVVGNSQEEIKVFALTRCTARDTNICNLVFCALIVGGFVYAICLIRKTNKIVAKGNSGIPASQRGNSKETSILSSEGSKNKPANETATGNSNGRKQPSNSAHADQIRIQYKRYRSIDIGSRDMRQGLTLNEFALSPIDLDFDGFANSFGNSTFVNSENGILICMRENAAGNGRWSFAPEYEDRGNDGLGTYLIGDERIFKIKNKEDNENIHSEILTIKHIKGNDKRQNGNRYTKCYDKGSKQCVY